MPLRKFATGSGLQIPFEFERSCFVAKRNDDIEFPRSMPPCVYGFTGIVCGQSCSNTRGHAGVVAIPIAEAPEHIHEAFWSNHDGGDRNLHTDEFHRRSRWICGSNGRDRQPPLTRWLPRASECAAVLLRGFYLRDAATEDTILRWWGDSLQGGLPPVARPRMRAGRCGNPSRLVHVIRSSFAASTFAAPLRRTPPFARRWSTAG